MDEEKMYCWYCDEEITNKDDMMKITVSNKVQYVHKECQELSENSVVNNTNNTVNNHQGTVNTLRTLAWINFAIGVIGAIIIWITMGTMEVPYDYIAETHTETNPLGIALGFATLFGSILTWAFLLVVCGMAENLIEIRNFLKK